jgi:tetratricopeptide (TPR) repeat protein
MQERIEIALTRALTIDPQSAAAYHTKSAALAYDKRQDWRGEIGPAIDAAEIALALNPNRPSTLAWLGRLYSKVGHPERTRALVRQAIRLSPRDPAMDGWLYTLGMSQLQMADNDDAIHSFQKSLLLAPRNLIAWSGLTGALLAAGRDDEAHSALAKFLESAAVEGGYSRLTLPTDQRITWTRAQLGLIRLGRWPYAIWPGNGPDISRALFKFQADENLPQTGWPDEATLARLGITSQVTASSSK